MSNSNTYSETADVICELVFYLEDLGIPYFVTGSIASSLRGEFRATNDIDIVAQLDVDKVKVLAERLSDTFFADEEAMIRAVNEKRSFNVIHKETVLKIDFFTKIDEFQIKQLSRANKEIIPGTDVEMCVATPEDIILSKLVWYRKGNEQSERQWRDILGVIDVSCKELDTNYLKHWAEELGVSYLLEKALR